MRSHHHWSSRQVLRTLLGASQRPTANRRGRQRRRSYASVAISGRVSRDPIRPRSFCDTHDGGADARINALKQHAGTSGGQHAHLVRKIREHGDSRAETRRENRGVPRAPTTGHFFATRPPTSRIRPSSASTRAASWLMHRHGFPSPRATHRFPSPYRLASPTRHRRRAFPGRVRVRARACAAANPPAPRGEHPHVAAARRPARHVCRGRPFAFPAAPRFAFAARTRGRT